MKTYPAKLLLFGEHTVNTGSKALALPLPVFSGRWQYAPHLSPAELAGRQMQLPQFAGYIERIQQYEALPFRIDTAALKNALQQGLVFESNIPAGYGAGSSGALVAAVAGEWALEETVSTYRSAHVSSSRLQELKDALAKLESFFHGASSGTDPLVCFLQQPVLLGGHEGVTLLQAPPLPPPYQLFLLDTGIQRKATPLITHFLEKMKDTTFRSNCHEELLPAVEGAIDRFLAGDGQELWQAFHTISHFQLRSLPGLIPAPFHPVWETGLSGQNFRLKLCGAGGGGFLLGIAKDFRQASALLSDYKVIPV